MVVKTEKLVITYLFTQKKAIAIDKDEYHLNIARKNYPKDNIEFISMDVFDYLKIKSQIIDVLILSHIIEHVDSPETLLLKCKDYFRKIYIEVPDFDKSYLSHYRKLTNNSLNYSDSDHIWEFDREDIYLLLSKCGLTIIDEEYRFGVIKIWCKNNDIKH